MNFQMFKLDLQKAEEPEMKLSTSVGSSKEREFQKKASTFALLTVPKPSKNWKILKEMGISNHLTCFLRYLYAGQEATVRIGHGTISSNLGKEYVKPVYCHPAYLTHMQSTSCKMLGWIKHKLKSRLPGATSITSDMQMTPP